MEVNRSKIDIFCLPFVAIGLNNNKNTFNMSFQFDSYCDLNQHFISVVFNLSSAVYTSTFRVSVSSLLPLLLL